MTIQIEVVKQHFPVFLFIMLYKVSLAFKIMNETWSIAIQMKAYCDVGYYFDHVSYFILPWPWAWKGQTLVATENAFLLV